MVRLFPSVRTGGEDSCGRVVRKFQFCAEPRLHEEPVDSETWFSFFPFMCLVLPQGGQDQGRREGQCEVSQTDLMSKYLKTKVNKMDFHFIMHSNCSHFWWFLQFRFVLISAACFSNHHGKIQSGSRAELVSKPMREWCESATFRKSLLLRLHTSRVDRPTGSSQRT